jgi:hypothetical protein
VAVVDCEGEECFFPWKDVLDAAPSLEALLMEVHVSVAPCAGALKVGLQELERRFAVVHLLPSRTSRLRPRRVEVWACGSDLTLGRGDRSPGDQSNSALRDALVKAGYRVPASAVRDHLRHADRRRHSYYY